MPVSKQLTVLKVFFNRCMIRNLAASNPVRCEECFLTEEEYARLLHALKKAAGVSIPGREDHQPRRLMLGLTADDCKWWLAAPDTWYQRRHAHSIRFKCLSKGCGHERFLSLDSDVCPDYIEGASSE
jgi:hypothetical protein